MEFKFINIYSKELADEILKFIESNKLITRQDSNSSWNTEENLRYFIKNKSKENYNFEEEPDLQSSEEIYTLIVFDDVVEIRYLMNCYEDETDVGNLDGLNYSNISDVIEQLQIVIDFIFNKKIQLNKFKNHIKKIYGEYYQQTIDSNDGFIEQWEKDINNDEDIEIVYDELGLYTSEEFNDFPYILDPVLLTLNNFDFWEDFNIEKLTEEFINNIIKRKDVNKIEIVKPEKL